jgi:hypothetical protein
MSKKSRKRNKKILAALALAGGAAMLAKGRGKGAVTGVVNPNLQKTIAADAGADIATDVVSSKIPERGRLTVGGKGPNEIAMERALTAGNRVPPSMRGGAPVAAGYQRRIPPQRGYRGGWTDQPFKGGGIAKRGTGVALKHGGRVKSMGIAKRGGGAAKR